MAKTIVRAAFVVLSSTAAITFGHGSALAAEAYLRVVDVGAGLCVVARTPAGRTLVYDAGPPGTRCRDAVAELVPEKRIDLLVLSHSDADHIGGAAGILADNEVLQILHPGDNRPERTANGARITLGQTRDAIDAETGAEVISLAEFDVDFGFSFDLGAAEAIFVAGWDDGNKSRGADESALSGGPLHNGLSIVIRFVYGGHSVLLTGDTVGRKDSDGSADTCRYAEARMVENAANVPIGSEVLIGQHHGADNASSDCFIAAVDPTYVVFSAGSNGAYKHPRARAASRFLEAGVDPDDIFRTDLGDNEGSPEWIYKSIRDCEDPAGDDDVEVWLPDSSSDLIRINYLNSSRRCRSS